MLKFLVSQFSGALPSRGPRPICPFSMSCEVTHFWNVMFCLPMPGGMPGIWPMSISILYSYRPSFIFPLNWSKGPAQAIEAAKAAQAAASRRAFLIVANPPGDDSGENTEFPLAEPLEYGL